MNREAIRKFFDDIDEHLTPFAAAREVLDLFLLGRSALMLGFGFESMTKDVDVVMIHHSDLMRRALEEFGVKRPGHDRHGFYLEDVSSGLPPLPNGYQNRCKPLDGNWRVIRPKTPEIHDLASTKLSRFHPRDRQDIQMLADTGDLTAEGLTSALESAFSFAADEDEDPKRRFAFANLRKVVAYLEGRSRTL